MTRLRQMKGHQREGWMDGWEFEAWRSAAELSRACVHMPFRGVAAFVCPSRPSHLSLWTLNRRPWFPRDVVSRDAVGLLEFAAIYWNDHEMTWNSTRLMSLDHLDPLCARTCFSVWAAIGGHMGLQSADARRPLTGAVNAPTTPKCNSASYLFYLSRLSTK